MGLHNALSTCSAEPADLSFCLLQEAGLLTEEPTFITLNLKKNTGHSQKQAYGALGKEKHKVTEVFTLSGERHCPESNF